MLQENSKYNDCIHKRENSILHACEYGSICLHLREVMDQRGINRNQVAKSIGSRFEVVDNWYHGDMEKLDMDVLARLCFVLDCRVEDLLEYRKNAEESET